MDTAGERFRDLGVDLPAETGQAAEGGLDMPAGATEAVVKVEMAERGIEVVSPHQADHTPAEPDAFGVSARSIDGLRGLDEFVGLALIVLVGVGGIGGGRLGGLILGGRGAALGERSARTDQEGQARSGEVAQNRTFEIKHPSTHTFPD